MVFSLVLVVAIAVGYLGRRSEVAEVRDQELTRAAEVGAARVDAVVDASRVAAMSADSPSAAVRAVRSTYPSVSACAGNVDESSCEGPLSQQLATVDLVPDDDLLEVTARDDVVIIEADGPSIAIRIVAPIDQWSGGSDDIEVVASTLQPTQGVGSLVESNGRRQTSAAVLSAPGTYVLAETSAAIRLPADEERFYALVAGLAVLLLLLAGTNLISEQRVLRERATFDALTKLPNRSEFHRRALEVLAAAERQEFPVCLLLFDLNGFKQINDTYGHQVGDELLRIVGQRLATSVRSDDLVARWGGDEFVALMPGMESEEMAVRRGRQIAECVAGRARIDGVADALRVRTSVGVALWPAHADDFDALLEAADDAMYRAKREGAVAAVAKPARDRRTADQPVGI